MAGLPCCEGRILDKSVARGFSLWIEGIRICRHWCECSFWCGRLGSLTVIFVFHSSRWGPQVPPLVSLPPPTSPIQTRSVSLKTSMLSFVQQIPPSYVFVSSFERTRRRLIISRLPHLDSLLDLSVTVLWCNEVHECAG